MFKPNPTSSPFEGKRPWMQAPLPGQSLTADPGAANYERPPKFSNVEKALGEYIDKLGEPDKKEKLLEILDAQVPISTLVITWTREGARRGIHSVDASVILRPMLHEYISVMAEKAGVDYIDHPSDLIKDTIKRREDVYSIAPMVEKNLRSIKPEPDGLGMGGDVPSVNDTQPVPDTTMPTMKPKGFMTPVAIVEEGPK